MLKLNIPSEETRYDILIIGAGPGGLTAAMYGARADLKVCFIEGSTPGGKVTSTDKIENYPGFETIVGADLALNMFQQANKLKAQYKYGWVESINKDETNHIFIVKTKRDETYYAKVVIIATGMKERKLGLNNEDKFEYKGISYCAVCDGSLYQNKDVVVIGGGNSAAQESLYLANICNKVYLVHRRNEFRCEAVLLNQIKNKENIEILTPYVAKEYIGEEHITGLIIKNVDTSEERLLNVACIFPYIGFNPNTQFLTNLDILNEQKQVITDQSKRTKIPGLYAIGDVTQNNFRQITTANSDGTVAALDAIDYINKNANYWSW